MLIIAHYSGSHPTTVLLEEIPPPIYRCIINLVWTEKVILNASLPRGALCSLWQDPHAPGNLHVHVCSLSQPSLYMGEFNPATK